MSGVPSQGQLVAPLLEAVRDAGGSIGAAEAADALAARFDLAEEVVGRSTRAARAGREAAQVVATWRRHVRFARQKAVAMGYLAGSADAASERGVWRETAVARDGLALARRRVVVTVERDREGRATAAHVSVDSEMPSSHALVRGDARSMGFLDDGSVQLCVTSVPYYDLKAYEGGEGQIAGADVGSYDAFLADMDRVLAEILRVLQPGGRLACNVGDVLRSRAAHGVHHVLPLHADLLVRGRAGGFECLNGILWRKVGNVSRETGTRNAPGWLGRPGQPNGIVAQGLEHVLLMRKPGPYRSPTPAQRRDAAITREEHARWFAPVWDDVPGARSGGHPAPFPLEVPRRLTRMFSFPGDLVLDPFAGSFTTTLAAASCGRDSLGVEASPAYLDLGLARVEAGLRAVA